MTVQFLDLPPDRYPVRIEIYELGETPGVDEPTWEATVTGPDLLILPAYTRDMRMVLGFGGSGGSTTGVKYAGAGP